MDSEKKIDACQYLYATIQMADWISDDYKRLAEKYLDNVALKELYLCICDGVNIDILELIEINDEVANVLSKCRKQHWESEFFRKYREEIEKLSVITASTQKEVKQMSGNVKAIVENMPSMNERFKMPEPDAVDYVQADKTPSKKEEVEDTKENVPNFGTNNLEESAYKSRAIVEPMFIKKEKQGILDRFKNLFDKYGHNPKLTVLNMLKKNYNSEQIDFILSCYDEGMTVKEIDRFADPRINVETMKLLKKVVLKERKKNGYR